MKNDNESKLMAKKICCFISERRDKKEIALLKEKPKKDKGGVNTRLFAVAKKLLSNPNDLKALELLKKKKKDKLQSAIEFQQKKYQEILARLDQVKLDNRLLDITGEYNEKVLSLNQEHQPNIWLNQWAGKAKDISFVTHVGKLTHSSSKSSSIYDKTTSVNSAYLTTNSISDLAVDTATTNAASAPAGEVLKLEVNGKSLLDYIKENNRTIFEHMSDNQEEINAWMTGFKQAYDSGVKTSHFLSKQVYFPTGTDSYHLLMPLVSSSMAHNLFSHFKEFSDDANTLIREQRKNKKYHPEKAVSYPNRASLILTRKPKEHSNISPLNKDRNGQLTLLSSKPPKWSRVQKLPLSKNSLFDRELNYKLRDKMKTLQNLLLVIKSKGISVNKPTMHKAITEAVIEVANGLFDEVSGINLASEAQGWTLESSFPLHQQLLFEPYRDDEIAVQAKIKKQWPADLAEDFSYWLNKLLNNHKSLSLTPIQQALWRDIFKSQLREFIATEEVAL